jgi:hypothetical protein
MYLILTAKTPPTSTALRATMSRPFGLGALEATF